LIAFLVAAFISPIPRDGGTVPAGAFIDCATCHRPFRNTKPECPFCRSTNQQRPQAPQTQKKYPACAELILAEARKCKHCAEAQPATLKARLVEQGLGCGS
jgi:hypothetical protein